MIMKVGQVRPQAANQPCRQNTQHEWSYDIELCYARKTIISSGAYAATSRLKFNMQNNFLSKLYLRELSDSKHHRRRLYSDRHLVTDLDIVQELTGHTGCVNALSWSSNGRLLASGSDDVHLNIHRYLPSDDSSSQQQFKLTTSVATGHTQNIFSVKFMPHSGDNTLITAAGDGEVRVFDIEYSGPPGQASRASTLASVGRRRAGGGAQTTYLTDGNTNARVYRSHGDRVKRIVTESSPHLFLSCSEDGEVRQWDLRLPSSAYPSSRGHRFGNGMVFAYSEQILSIARNADQLKIPLLPQR